MAFMRIDEDNVAVELFETLPEFHPDFMARIFEVGSSVTLGWVRDPDSGLFYLPDPNIGVTEHIIPLDELRIICKKLIDNAAEEVRAKFITNSAGQVGTYLLKLEEAKSYTANGYPVDTTGYPVITNEAGGRGLSVAEVADSILAADNAWRGIAGNIEGIRLKGKHDIDLAVDTDGVKLIKDTAILNLNLI